MDFVHSVEQNKKEVDMGCCSECKRALQECTLLKSNSGTLMTEWSQIILNMYPSILILLVSSQLG